MNMSSSTQIGIEMRRVQSRKIETRSKGKGSCCSARDRHLLPSAHTSVLLSEENLTHQMGLLALILGTCLQIYQTTAFFIIWTFVPFKVHVVDENRSKILDDLLQKVHVYHTISHLICQMKGLSKEMKKY